MWLDAWKQRVRVLTMWPQYWPMDVSNPKKTNKQTKNIGHCLLSSPPQVIVFYHHPSGQDIPVMWPGSKIPAPWANTTEPSKLLQVRDVQTLCVITVHSVENQYRHLWSLFLQDWGFELKKNSSLLFLSHSFNSLFDCKFKVEFTLCPSLHLQ